MSENIWRLNLPAKRFSNDSRSFPIFYTLTSVYQQQFMSSSKVGQKSFIVLMASYNISFELNTI